MDPTEYKRMQNAARAVTLTSRTSVRHGIFWSGAWALMFFTHELHLSQALVATFFFIGSIGLLSFWFSRDNLYPLWAVPCVIAFGMFLRAIPLDGQHVFRALMLGCVAMMLLISAIESVRAARTIFLAKKSTETATVERWLDQLDITTPTDEIITVSSTSFVRGNRTFKLARHGEYWVVKEFQTSLRRTTAIAYYVFSAEDLHYEQSGPNQCLVLGKRKLKGAVVRSADLPKLAPI